MPHPYTYMYVQKNHIMNIGVSAPGWCSPIRHTTSSSSQVFVYFKLSLYPQAHYIYSYVRLTFSNQNRKRGRPGRVHTVWDPGSCGTLSSIPPPTHSKSSDGWFFTFDSLYHLNKCLLHMDGWLWLRCDVQLSIAFCVWLVVHLHPHTSYVGTLILLP